MVARSSRIQGGLRSHKLPREDTSGSELSSPSIDVSWVGNHWHIRQTMRRRVLSCTQYASLKDEFKGNWTQWHTFVPYWCSYWHLGMFMLDGWRKTRVWFFAFWSLRYHILSNCRFDFAFALAFFRGRMALEVTFNKYSLPGRKTKKTNKTPITKTNYCSFSDKPLSSWFRSALLKQRSSWSTCAPSNKCPYETTTVSIQQLVSHFICGARNTSHWWEPLLYAPIRLISTPSCYLSSLGTNCGLCVHHAPCMEPIDLVLCGAIAQNGQTHPDQLYRKSKWRDWWWRSPPSTYWALRFVSRQTNRNWHQLNQKGVTPLGSRSSATCGPLR